MTKRSTFKLKQQTIRQLLQMSKNQVYDFLTSALYTFLQIRNAVLLDVDAEHLVKLPWLLVQVRTACFNNKVYLISFNTQDSIRWVLKQVCTYASGRYLNYCFFMVFGKIQQVSKNCETRNTNKNYQLRRTSMIKT